MYNKHRNTTQGEGLGLDTGGFLCYHAEKSTYDKLPNYAAGLIIEGEGYDIYRR